MKFSTLIILFASALSFADPMQCIQACIQQAQTEAQACQQKTSPEEQNACFADVQNKAQACVNSCQQSDKTK